MVRFAPADRVAGERFSRREAALNQRIDLGDEPCPMTLRIAELEAELQQKEAARADAVRAAGVANKYRNDAERREKAAAEDNEELKLAIEKLEQRVADGPSRKNKEIKSQATFSERVKELADFADKQYDRGQLPQLFLSVLKKLSKKGGEDLRAQLARCKNFGPALSLIHLQRDRSNAEYLKKNVFNREAFALLRLIVNLSKRECALICAAFKYRRDKQGKRVRTKMNSDSCIGAPTLFDLLEIVAEEKAALERSKLKLEEQADRGCAYVAGEFGIDDAIFSAIEASKTERTGGMSILPGVTDGESKETGHVVCMTGDGAGLTLGKSGVAIRLFLGSTEFLNQSSNDCIDIVQYEERHNAEHYTVLRARTKEIRPVLARLHADGELRPGGVRSGVFVRICLVADKPFIRHVCGLTSHNADAFGAPFCKCCDRDIYKFSFDKKSHYGNVTFEQLCSRAHIPTWQALGQSEPAEWCFECDGCGEVRCSSSSRVLDSPLVISIRLLIILDPGYPRALSIIGW